MGNGCFKLRQIEKYNYFECQPARISALTFSLSEAKDMMEPELYLINKVIF